MRSAKLNSSASCSASPPNPDSRVTDVHLPESPPHRTSQRNPYHKYPDDETYAHLMVNYVKLDRLPGFDQDWNPILKAMRAGDFFITSGEILFKRFAVEGAGNKRT